MNIGILGGTFDPPHKGHLHISLEASKRFKLQKIIWLLTNQNPLKKNQPSKNIKERIENCKKFTNKNKNLIKILNTENITKSNYLFNNLNYIINKSKHNNYFFIMGADSFIQFNKWKKNNTILKKLSLIIINRPNFTIKSLNSISAKKFEKLKSNNHNLITNRTRWYFVNSKIIKLSSTELRKNQ